MKRFHLLKIAGLAGVLACSPVSAQTAAKAAPRKRRAMRAFHTTPSRST